MSKPTYFSFRTPGHASRDQWGIVHGRKGDITKRLQEELPLLKVNINPTYASAAVMGEINVSNVPVDAETLVLKVLREFGVKCDVIFTRSTIQSTD